LGEAFPLCTKTRSTEQENWKAETKIHLDVLGFEEADINIKNVRERSTWKKNCEQKKDGPKLKGGTQNLPRSGSF
jgi:hypothetical protein